MAQLTFTSEEFDQVLQKAKDLYFTLGRIYCPYFHDAVHFDTRGLEHLRRKTWNRGRKQRDQFMRLKHLARAPEILGLAHTLQGLQETTEWERQHRHGRWEKLLVRVIYYEFIAVLDGRRFKVIVKEIPNGRNLERVFWSLIPFWRQSKQGTRIISDGNPAVD